MTIINNCSMAFDMKSIRKLSSVERILPKRSQHASTFRTIISDLYWLFELLVASANGCDSSETCVIEYKSIPSGGARLGSIIVLIYLVSAVYGGSLFRGNCVAVWMCVLETSLRLHILSGSALSPSSINKWLNNRTEQKKKPNQLITLITWFYA